MIRKYYEYTIIKKSGLFDSCYYLREYKDVRQIKVDPLIHFITLGWKEGKNPSEKFNTNYYLKMYPDVNKAGLNPLVHYIKYGKKEKRMALNTTQISANPEKQSLTCEKLVPNLSVEMDKIIQSSDTYIQIDSHSKKSDLSQTQIDSLMDDYFELHYQFSKFKQKPIIRIASRVDSLFPENGLIQRSLHYMVSSLSILKNQGLSELIKMVKNIKRNSKRIKHSEKKSAIVSFNNGKYIELSSEISEYFLDKSSNKPPQLPDVIVFPFINWEYRIQRPQHLAEQLAELGHRVFYIQANFYPGIIPEIKKIKENIYLVRLPEERGTILFNSTLSKDNIVSLESSILKIVYSFNIHSAILIVDLPFWRKLAVRLREAFGWKLVYDCMDDYAGFSNSSDLAAKDEQLLLGQSDLVLATSHILFEKVKKENKNSILIHNGTDFDLFHKAAQEIETDEINKLDRPIIGYYGAIADWFDTELVRNLASAHPEWTFVLIGSTELADLKPIKGLSNIHLLGEKPYIKLPEYLSNFDVCIIPFIKSPLTDTTNPVKLFEFLSAGKPIVATKLNEISNYGEFIFLAETQKEWELLIQKALLEEKTKELLTNRFTFARNNSWENRAEVLESSISSLFPKISIIVITFNNLEYTKLCLESIVKNTEYPNYEIIVVDNASHDGTIEFIKDYKNNRNNVFLITNDKNLGFAAANNLGVNASRGEYIVFLNNDTIVTPGWLHKLYQHLVKSPSVGMVGPVTNAIGNEAKIEVDYTELADINYFAAKREEKFSGVTFNIRVLALYCCMISRELFDQIGGLDERYHIGMFEDDDLALKIEQEGLNLICAEDVFIHHFHGASFKKLEDQEYQRIFFENKMKFEEKWGVKWQPHQNRR